MAAQLEGLLAEPERSFKRHFGRCLSQINRNQESAWLDMAVFLFPCVSLDLLIRSTPKTKKHKKTIPQKKTLSGFPIGYWENETNHLQQNRVSSFCAPSFFLFAFLLRLFRGRGDFGDFGDRDLGLDRSSFQNSALGPLMNEGAAPFDLVFETRPWDGHPLFADGKCSICFGKWEGKPKIPLILSETIGKQLANTEAK